MEAVPLGDSRLSGEEGRARLTRKNMSYNILYISLKYWPVTCRCSLHALKGGAYPRPRMVARVVTTLQLFAAETCNKFLKIEHHDSIVYSKHELILTFLAGATSDFTAGNTTQERLDLPARFFQ